MSWSVPSWARPPPRPPQNFTDVDVDAPAAHRYYNRHNRCNHHHHSCSHPHPPSSLPPYPFLCGPLHFYQQPSVDVRPSPQGRGWDTPVSTAFAVMERDPEPETTATRHMRRTLCPYSSSTKTLVQAPPGMQLPSHQFWPWHTRAHSQEAQAPLHVLSASAFGPVSGGSAPPSMSSSSSSSSSPLSSLSSPLSPGELNRLVLCTRPGGGGGGGGSCAAAVASDTIGTGPAVATSITDVDTGDSGGGNSKPAASVDAEPPYKRVKMEPKSCQSQQRQLPLHAANTIPNPTVGFSNNDNNENNHAAVGNNDSADGEGGTQRAGVHIGADVDLMPAHTRTPKTRSGFRMTDTAGGSSSASVTSAGRISTRTDGRRGRTGRSRSGTTKMQRKKQPQQQGPPKEQKQDQHPQQGLQPQQQPRPAPAAAAVGVNIDRRSLRSHDGGSRTKSELMAYFPNYEQIMSFEPEQRGVFFLFVIPCKAVGLLTTFFAIM